MSGFEFANGLTAAISRAKDRRGRRRIDITDTVSGNEVHLTFSPKGRDVAIHIAGIEISVTFSVLRKLADKGCWHLDDTLIELGWTPPDGG